ncbi:MAG TPA: hypothetical protein VI911_02555 [Patescibacteria group bacterium]|nr:hypothetical protein [Patescibacteria group bacterium]
MALERKTGTYFVDGLSARSDKHIFSKNFETIGQAIKIAKKWQNKRKIVQAQIMFTKNALSDIEVWRLDTKGKIKRYNQENKQFEEY